MSPLAQVMSLDQGGGLGEEVTEDQIGSPERLCFMGSEVDLDERGGARCES